MAPQQQPDPNPRRFAGLGIQLLAVIALAAWAGSWLDQKLQLTFPAFTLGLVLTGFAGVMVKIWYDLNRNS